LAGNGFDESRFVTFETRRERESERERESQTGHTHCLLGNLVRLDAIIGLKGGMFAIIRKAR
jgi:hypothetical protein